jgi:dolichol-phosphate mannosyltransferase
MRSPTYSPKATPSFDWRPRVSVVLPTYNESGNIGRLIAAVREAVEWMSELEVEESAGDVVVVMDTDFNHQPEMIPQMIDFLRYYDLVTGSRFTVGGGMEERGRYRLSFLFNFFCRLLLGTGLQDHLSGFFAVRRETILQLDLDDVFDGYGDYFIRLLVESLARGYTVLEVPVYYPARIHGESKTKFLRTLSQYTRAVLRLALRRRPKPA